jgi:hypothetical protein
VIGLLEELFHEIAAEARYGPEFELGVVPEEAASAREVLEAHLLMHLLAADVGQESADPDELVQVAAEFIVAALREPIHDVEAVGVVVRRLLIDQRLAGDDVREQIGPYVAARDAALVVQLQRVLGPDRLHLGRERQQREVVENSNVVDVVVELQLRGHFDVDVPRRARVPCRPKREQQARFPVADDAEDEQLEERVTHHLDIRVPNHHHHHHHQHHNGERSTGEVNQTINSFVEE